MSLQAGKTTESDLFLVIPAGKKIKIEPLDVTVEVEQNLKGTKTRVWATFHKQLFLKC